MHELNEYEIKALELGQDALDNFRELSGKQLELRSGPSQEQADFVAWRQLLASREAHSLKRRQKDMFR